MPGLIFLSGLSPNSKVSLQSAEERSTIKWPTARGLEWKNKRRCPMVYFTVVCFVTYPLIGSEGRLVTKVFF